MDGDRQALTELMRTAVGYWRSQVLFTALELGILDAIARAPRTPGEVADRASTSPEGTEALLRACAAIGLAERRDGGFVASGPVREHLGPDARPGMRNWVRFIGRCYSRWEQLPEMVRTGEPVEDGPALLEGDPEFARTLVLAMHDYARGPGRALGQHLDLSACSRLLDVGGGVGSYSMLLARRHPDLRAVVLELPTVAEIGRSVVAEEGLADRVTFRPGDYTTDDFGSGFDAVLFSNVLHQEDPDAVRALLAKGREALEPGGRLVVQASFLPPDGVGSPWTVLQSLQLGLFYEGGRNYSAEEMRELARDAGFENVDHRRMSMLNTESIVLGRKPTREPAAT